MERKTGTVKWFNARKGYGFITCYTDDIFVHHSSLNTVGYRYLVQGEVVEFTLAPAPANAGAIMAVDVTGLKRNKLICESHDKKNASVA